jgi:1-acylglycerone phosphate reductase
MAREFHTHGLRVFATARNPKKMANLEELGIERLTLDVDDHESVTKCFANVNEAVGDQGVAYLVNSASIGMIYTSTSLSKDFSL